MMDSRPRGLLQWKCHPDEEMERKDAFSAGALVCSPGSGAGTFDGIVLRKQIVLPIVSRSSVECIADERFLLDQLHFSSLVNTFTQV